MDIIEKITGSRTFGEKFLWGSAFLAAITISIGLGCEEIKKTKLNLAEKRELKKYKSSVIKYIDKNQNGLDFQENYKIKELMEIQNRSTDYIPTLEDWKKAYNKINK